MKRQMRSPPSSQGSDRQSTQAAASPGLTPTQAAVKQQLERILASALFARSQQLKQLLSFIVTSATAGKGNQLKEYVLGVEALGRKDSFDPRIDPIVRVEVGRLRSKLTEYYETVGSRDPVLIRIPKRTYVPSFEQRRARHVVTRTLSEAKRAISFHPGRAAAAIIIIFAAATVFLGVLHLQYKTSSLSPVVDSENGRPLPGLGPVPIVVAPFVPLSESTDVAHFSTGLTEDVVAALVKTNAISVFGVSSQHEFETVSQDAAKDSEQVHEAALLRGSVRKSEDSLRISAHLVDPLTGRYMWSQIYEREPRDALVDQSDISELIVRSLKTPLFAWKESRDAPRSTSLIAQNLYLKGRFSWNKRDAGGIERAISYFRQAISLDPGYARAYAGLADAYEVAAFYRLLPPQEAISKAESAAMMAQTIDPALAEVQRSLANIRLRKMWDWETAETHFKRAITLNPNYATAHHWYAHHLLSLGRLDEAYREMKRAQELDPLSPVVTAHVGRVLYMRRQYDEAIEHYKDTLNLNPYFGRAHMELGWVYVEKEMFKETRRSFETARSLSIDSTGAGAVAALAYCDAQSGRESQARDALNQLVEMADVPAFDVSLVHLSLGEGNEALKWLERACQEDCMQLSSIGVDPLFDAVRAEPEYRNLLRKIRL